MNVACRDPIAALGAKHPKNDWRKVKGSPHSYYANLMEEPVLEDVFLYCVFWARQERMRRLRISHQLGDSRSHEAMADALLKSNGIILPVTDRSSLLRKLMEVEIKALEDLTAGNASQVLVRLRICERGLGVTAGGAKARNSTESNSLSEQ